MELKPLDPGYVADVLSLPPFVRVEGVHNIRDLGLYPSSYDGKVTKPHFAFRSAEISSITEEGGYDFSQHFVCISITFRMFRPSADERLGHHPCVRFAIRHGDRKVPQSTSHDRGGEGFADAYFSGRRLQS
jgi:hypothetical protein